MFKFIAFFLMSTALLFGEQETNDWLQGLRALDWKTTGTYRLPHSHSSLLIPADHLGVFESDAQKPCQLMDNDFDQNIEAVVLDGSLENDVYFEYCDDGYVSLDSWSKIDPVQLMKGLKRNIKDSNKGQRNPGHHVPHVVGWIQEPTLDRDKHTVFWAIKGKDSDFEEYSVSATAIKLGRHGYERLTWIGDLYNFKAFGGKLDEMLRAHSFDSGYNYSDYIPGDNVAQYGIATLVGASMGGKVVKFVNLRAYLDALEALFIAGLIAILYKKKMRQRPTEG